MLAQPGLGLHPDDLAGYAQEQIPRSAITGHGSGISAAARHAADNRAPGSDPLAPVPLVPDGSPAGYRSAPRSSPSTAAIADRSITESGSSVSIRSMREISACDQPSRAASARWLRPEDCRAVTSSPTNLADIDRPRRRPHRIGSLSSPCRDDGNRSLSRALLRLIRGTSQRTTEGRGSGPENAHIRHLIPGASQPSAGRSVSTVPFVR